MRFFVKAIVTLGLLGSVESAIALQPPGTNAVISPTANRTYVRLTDKTASSTGWCQGGKYLALVDATGTVKASPFVVPGSARFVITDIAWRAFPMAGGVAFTSSDSVSLYFRQEAELYPAGSDSQFGIPADRVSSRVATGHMSFVAGPAFVTSARLCVGAGIDWVNGGAGAELGEVNVFGYVQEI